MTTFELLVFIFVIIETIQVYFLLRNNRKLKNLVEEIITNEEYAARIAVNCLFGFMDDVNNDEEKQKTFFNFVGSCGINAAIGIKDYFSGTGELGPNAGVDTKGLPPIVKKGLKFADAIGIDVRGMVKSKMKDAVEAKVDSWS